VDPASGSFINLIGLRPDEAQQASCTEFRSLLADDESRRTYDDVEGRRRRSEKVDPYHVTLKRKDGHTVRVRIVSATVPASTDGKMPETFGLLLTQSEENLVPVDFVDAAKRSVSDRAS
jgi:PAS domain-containing protein